MQHKAVKLDSVEKSVPIFGMVGVPQYTGIPLQLPGHGSLNKLGYMTDYWSQYQHS